MLSSISKTALGFIVVVLFIFLGTVNSAQSIEKVQIMTPTVQCEMCKKTIEKALNKIKGVVSSDVNYKKKFVTVKYTPEILTISRIRKTISEAGYDADNLQAKLEAYNNLPICCKLPKDK